MMLSAMWLPTLRGEGNQPFYLQGRGRIQGLTPDFPQLSSKCLSFSRNPTPFLFFTAVPVPGWLVGPERPSIPVKSSFPQRYKSQYPKRQRSKNKQREKWLFPEVWRANWLGYLALLQAPPTSVPIGLCEFFQKMSFSFAFFFLTPIYHRTIATPAMTKFWLFRISHAHFTFVTNYAIVVRHQVFSLSLAPP